MSAPASLSDSGVIVGDPVFAAAYNSCLGFVCTNANGFKTICKKVQEFYQAVPLPPGIAADKVEANYRNGVLTVTLPKTEASQGRRIAVRG